MSCKKPHEHSRKKPRCARIDTKILALSCRAFQNNSAEQQHWSLTLVFQANAVKDEKMAQWLREAQQRREQASR